MDEEDLEKLKKEKLQQMQQSGGAGMGQAGGQDMQDLQEQQEEEIRKKIKKIASQILTKEARSRLGNLRTVKPEMASKIEMQLIQLHRMGQIQDKITDEQLKSLLRKIQSSNEEDERDIKFR